MKWGIVLGIIVVVLIGLLMEKRKRLNQ